MSSRQPAISRKLIPRSEWTVKHRILVTTGNDVAGRQIVQYLGVVRGLVVRSPGFGQRLSGGFAALGGGNIQAFEEVCEEGRREAYARMVDHAGDKGADAIIGMRYDATEFAEGITEVLAYGTAVKLEPAAEVLEAEPAANP
jgi:uncharacterized protein YbjQ (UPF0145 family)